MKWNMEFKCFWFFGFLLIGFCVLWVMSGYIKVLKLSINCFLFKWVFMASRNSGIAHRPYVAPSQWEERSETISIRRKRRRSTIIIIIINMKQFLQFRLSLFAGNLHVAGRWLIDLTENHYKLFHSFSCKRNSLFTY